MGFSTRLCRRFYFRDVCGLPLAIILITMILMAVEITNWKISSIKRDHTTYVTEEFTILNVEAEDIEDGENKGSKCPTSFRATILLRAGERNLTQEVLVRTPAAWLSSKDERLIQKNMIRMSMLENLLSWGIPIPNIFILLLDPDEPQIGSEVTIDLAERLLSCTKQNSLNHILLFATGLDDWYAQFAMSSQSASLVDLFKLIANCKSLLEKQHEEETLEDDMFTVKSSFVSIEPINCFLPNAKGIADTSHSKELIMLPISKEYLCNIPVDVISHLRLLSDYTSPYRTLGTSLKELMSNVYVYLEERDSFNGVYSEIDSRVANLLGEYEYHCWHVSDEERVMSDMHTAFQNLPILNMTYVRSGRYIKATLDQGFEANMKYISPSPERTRFPTYFNQGPGELVAHYIDRLLGTYLTPTCVYRRVPLTANCSDESSSCGLKYSYKEFLIDGINGYDPEVHYSRNMMIQNKEDSSGHYIDYALVGWVKDIHQLGRTTPLEPLSSYRGVIKQYFQHNLTQTETLQYGVIRQDLIDISDVLLFNFLVHDWDHAWLKNWAKSGLRFLSFDNGLAFDDVIPNAVCEPLLKCPFFFCHLFGSKKSCIVPDDIPSFCRFNRNTVVRLRRVSLDEKANQMLGDRIKELVTKSPWYNDDYVKYFGKYDISYGINQRVIYALKYVDSCVEYYGDSTFI